MSVATPRTDFDPETGGRWPRSGTEAYARYRGPYTVENASTLLQEEPLELYNGWLVWDKLTDFEERGFAANIEEILSMVARLMRFGRAYPDQVECELVGGDVIKPDVCLVSDERVKNRLAARGPDKRLLLQGGPELAVELRSPSNTRAEERRKRKQYFENGTSLVWDVDPKRKHIWVWHAETPDQHREYKGDDLIDCEPLLPGWRRRTADFFAQNLSAEEVTGQAAQEWRADERQKERRNTLCEMLLLTAGVKFGSDLPADRADDLAERLNRLNAEQLTALVASITTSATLDDWLASFPA
jgi:Uma2 family endonuclease